MPTPLATVVVPCRNAGPHLGELLRSLLAQSRQDFDLLLADDASTDGSADLARTVAGDRVIVHRNPCALGIPGNWNRCAELVRTPLFCLAHQDDVYAPRFLERMAAALLERPDAAFAHCQSTTIDELGRCSVGPAEQFKRRFWRHLESADPSSHYALLHAGNFIACSSVLFRTAAFRAAGGFRSDLRFAADWELWLRLLLHEKAVCAVAEPLVAYRRHQGAATAAAANDLSRYQEELAVATWARQQGMARGWLTERTPHARALRNNLLQDAYADLAAGDRPGAERKLAFLREHAPWLWKDPMVRMFRSLRWIGAPGRLLLRVGRAVAVRAGPWATRGRDLRVPPRRREQASGGEHRTRSAAAEAGFAHYVECPAAPAGTGTVDSRSPSSARRTAIVLLAIVSAYLAATLALAIARTSHQDQDAAYYCEVVERNLAGEGFTSLADRRGPAEPRPWPQPFEAQSRWPWVLATVARLTGEAEHTGAVLSALALLWTVWLTAWAIGRGRGASFAIAALAAAVALSHRVAVRAATLPETDSVALCANVACVALLIERRWLVALLLAALAILVRFQSLALVFPFAAVVLERHRRLRGATLLLGVAAGLWFARDAALQGLGYFLDPTQRGSYLRTVRWLCLPAVFGLWLARRERGLAPFWWLAVGHFLVILASPDLVSEVPFLFGIRHGLPLHVTTAALVAVALARLRGWPGVIVWALVGIAALDNLPRAWKEAATRVEHSALPSVDAMLDFVRGGGIPPEAIVASWDADILAREARVRTVHLRGFDLLLDREGAPAVLAALHARGVTHAAVTWVDKPAIARFNQRFDRLHAAFAGGMDVIGEWHSEAPRMRTVLLAWKRP